MSADIKVTACEPEDSILQAMKCLRKARDAVKDTPSFYHQINALHADLDALLARLWAKTGEQP